MSNQLRNLAIAAVVAIVALATPARADLQIWASATDNPPTSADKVAEGTTVANAASPLTVGSFTITGLEAATDSPGNIAIGQENGATTSVTNTGSATATLYITVGSTGFTLPVTPPNILLESGIGGTVTIGSGANLLTYQSYVDTANGQNTITGSITSGAQKPGITTVGVYDNNASTTITSLAATYSITEYLAITLGAGSEVNFSSTTNLVSTSAVPEPSSLVLGGLGALGFIGYGLRRRKAKGA